MAKLTIPDQYLEGILKLMSLNDETVSILRDLLSSEADDLSARELASVASGSLPGVPEKDIQSVLSSLRAMYLVRSSREVSLEEFVSDLADALEEVPDAEVNAEMADQFKKRVSILLAIDPFAIQIKGRDLQTEDERTFCKARILTDLRPVFGDDVSEGIRGMVLIHHLKLGFHQNGTNHSDFHVSLDSEDLQALKSAIERAEAKAQNLHEAFPGTRFLGL